METFQLPMQDLQKLFPFSFLTDNQGLVLEAGPSIQKLMKSDLVQSQFDSQFSFVKPGIAEFRSLPNIMEGEMIIISDKKFGHQLMGQILKYPEQGVCLFIVSLFVQTIDELRPLGLTFNDFPIQDQIFDFLMLFQTHNKAIRQADALNKQLAEAHKVAVEASELKSQFLANMSHELRTPMNGVLGMAGVLAETTLSDSQKEYVQCIMNSGEAMLNLINDILDTSKIESGHISIDSEIVNIPYLVDEINKSLSLSAQKRGNKLEVDLQNLSTPDLWVDKSRLRQVLTNLVGNAIKFTENGLVRIEIHTVLQPDQKKGIQFAVSDTGIGMSPETVEGLFVPFHQGDSSMTKKFGGTGLGLSICKKLVEAMGGEIKVATRPSEGSQFWFTLPFRESEASITPNQV